MVDWIEVSYVRYAGNFEMHGPPWLYPLTIAATGLNAAIVHVFLLRRLWKLCSTSPISTVQSSMTATDQATSSSSLSYPRSPYSPSVTGDVATSIWSHEQTVGWSDIYGHGPDTVSVYF
jgi:hypothetical protein